MIEQGHETTQEPASALCRLQTLFHLLHLCSILNQLIVFCIASVAFLAKVFSHIDFQFGDFSGDSHWVWEPHIPVKFILYELLQNHVELSLCAHDLRVYVKRHPPIEFSRAHHDLDTIVDIFNRFKKSFFSNNC